MGPAFIFLFPQNRRRHFSEDEALVAAASPVGAAGGPAGEHLALAGGELVQGVADQAFAVEIVDQEAGNLPG